MSSRSPRFACRLRWFWRRIVLFSNFPLYHAFERLSYLDAGQSLNIIALAANDSSGDGCSFSLTGPGAIALVPGGGLFPANAAVNYSAPASVASATTAVVKATSIKDTSKSGTVTIVVNSAVAFPSQTLPLPHAGIVYSATLSASGGTGTLSFVSYMGVLPAGISLSKSGVLSGTPTTTGTYTFTIQAQDQATQLQGADQTFTVTVI